MYKLFKFIFLGCVGDDIDPNSATEDFPWETYWSSIFRKITDNEIRDYELKYKGIFYLKLLGIPNSKLFSTLFDLFQGLMMKKEILKKDIQQEKEIWNLL